MLKRKLVMASKYFNVSLFQPKNSCFESFMEILYVSKNHFDFNKTAYFSGASFSVEVLWEDLEWNMEVFISMLWPSSTKEESHSTHSISSCSKFINSSKENSSWDNMPTERLCKQSYMILPNISRIPIL